MMTRVSTSTGFSAFPVTCNGRSFGKMLDQKAPKLAVTAIMRKLVLLANALLRDGRKWADRTA